MKNFGENEDWAYRGNAQIFGVPLSFRERVKRKTSNLVSTFIGAIQTKPIKNFGEK